MFFHMILLKCLIKFKEEIIKQDPDIITGWNIIDFDILYLKNLFKKNKISFDIGRTNDEPHLRIESGFFKASTANIPGRQVIDAFNSIKDPYIKEAPSIKHAEFETYSLEAVAQAVLGTGKLIKGKDRYEEIERMYKTNQKKLVDYNILDCKLAYDILKKPGIYNNVLVLDFKSLYPSIMRTFNIDAASRLEKKESGAIESPNHVYFINTEGILPKLIEKMHTAREKAKKEKRELSNYAIKIIMNSFFGVLANTNCRYYNYDMANAITHFGQMIIKLTREQIEKKGYKVIYQETDSCFVESALPLQKARALG